MPSRNSVLFLCSGNYYRSRFAEALFNQFARVAALPFEALSAGLTPEHFDENPGPISKYVIAALEGLAIECPMPHRAPRAATPELLASATHIVALNEREHRPLILARFPDHLLRVAFWHVDDVDRAPPDVALPLVERNVRALVAVLAKQSRL